MSLRQSQAQFGRCMERRPLIRHMMRVSSAHQPIPLLLVFELADHKIHPERRYVSSAWVIERKIGDVFRSSGAFGGSMNPEMNEYHQ